MSGAPIVWRNILSTRQDKAVIISQFSVSGFFSSSNVFNINELKVFYSNVLYTVSHRKEK